MWYRCIIRQHYRVRIEPVRSLGGKVYWTTRIVRVSDRFPEGRLFGARIVEDSEARLWKRICSTIRNGG